MQLAPGLSEIVENLVHYASTGHAAHALADAEHAPEDAEHGCSATFHLCQCHATSSITIGSLQTALGAPLLTALPAPRAGRDLLPDGYLSGVFRPPIA